MTRNEIPGACLRGIPASPGVAVGRVVRLHRARPEIDRSGGDPADERRRLERAIDEARLQLQALQARLHRESDASRAAIFAAQEALLSDPQLLETALAGIVRGLSAAAAWDCAIATHAARLEGLASEVLASRAADLRDVGDRVLRLLVGTRVEAVSVGGGSIIVAEELTPSEVAGLDRTCVVGVCMVRGGATSHAAILAQARGLPALVAVDPRVLALADGTPAILDATGGWLRVNPDHEEMAAARARGRAWQSQRTTHLERAHEPASTRDGRRIEVWANLTEANELDEALRAGAEGVGLLRTEFLFLPRATIPSADDQAEVLEGLAAAIGPRRPLVVRLLDAGGDKALASLPRPPEANPLLGERGIRLLLAHEDVCRAQLQAILRASRRGAVQVLVPMVSRVDEVHAVKAWLEQERARLGVAPVPVGIMVEVPAAALLGDRFAREVDFFAIGTNDLAQYTLAVDRGHARLAPTVDGLDPAVLALVAHTVRAARGQGRRVSVCGALASDPQAIPLLVGLGVDALSVVPAAIPGVKALIRTLDGVRCRLLADRALQMSTASEVRALIPQEAWATVSPADLDGPGAAGRSPE